MGKLTEEEQAKIKFLALGMSFFAFLIGLGVGAMIG